MYNNKGFNRVLHYHFNIDIMERECYYGPKMEQY